MTRSLLVTLLLALCLVGCRQNPPSFTASQCLDGLWYKRLWVDGPWRPILDGQEYMTCEEER